MARILLEFVDQRVAGLQALAVHPHAHALVVRFDHHALVAHAAHQVERLLGLAAQRQFFHVGGHAPLDRRPQLPVDGKKAVRRTHALQSLMRPLVVVILDPVGDPFAGLLEGLEARPHQELLLERLPEPLDLPQRHRMMRRAADVVDVVLGQLLLEGRLAPPTGVLAAVVGEHLARRPVLRDRFAVDLHHESAGLAAEDAQPRDVAGVVVDEAYDVGRLPQDGEVGDVALPHLVGRGALEAAGRRRCLLPRLGLGQCRQAGGLEVLADRLGAGLQAEEPPQDLRDAPDPLPRILPLQLRDLVLDRRGHFGGQGASQSVLKPRLAIPSVAPEPLVDRRGRDPQFAGHQGNAEAFLHVQLHGATPHLVCR
jgi:hypothetical protein